jgi:predicted RNase H-like HicB family nuclease
MKKSKTLDQYLREPYTRVLIPDPESNTFTAQVLEFPGCVAQGDTPQEAYANLEEAAKGWIQAALDMGQHIPEPSANQSCGGKVLVRLSRSLHRQAALVANHEGISLNQLFVTAIAEKVGAASVERRLTSFIQDCFARTDYKFIGREIPLHYGVERTFKFLVPGTFASARAVTEFGDLNETLKALVAKSEEENREVSGHG